MILDRPARAGDMELARHVCYVHRHGSCPPRPVPVSVEGQQNEEPKSAEFMRAYIAAARQYQPTVPQYLPPPNPYDMRNLCVCVCCDVVPSSSSSPSYTHTVCRVAV